MSRPFDAFGLSRRAWARVDVATDPPIPTGPPPIPFFPSVWTLLIGASLVALVLGWVLS